MPNSLMMANQAESQSSPFTLIIEGPVIQENYPVVGISELTVATAKILQWSALSALPRHSKRNARVDVEVLGTFPRPGSYLQELFLSARLHLPEGAAPVLLTIGALELIHNANECFEFINHLKDLLRRRKKPEVRGRVGDSILIAGEGEQESCDK